MKLIKDKTAEPLPENIRLELDNYVVLEIEEDITSLESIDICDKAGRLNFLQFRSCYGYLGKSFESQDEPTQLMICDLCRLPMNDIIGFYISRGISMNDAINRYISNYCQGIKNASIICESVINSNNLTILLVEYMPLTEIGKFFINAYPLIAIYREKAWFGTTYGDGEGVWDFIHDQGSFIGKGLSTYTLNEGKNLQEFISRLDNVLFNFI